MSTSSPGSNSSGPGPDTPKRIGPYKLLHVLGEGGMGTVFLAEQTEPVRRRVALKLIKLGMDTREVIARFEAERQALAIMNHPNIARVLDAGSSVDGRPYFVMENVPGISLTSYCEKHRLRLGARLDLFLQVCAGVQHAHQKGIIHRDIKPSNILVQIRDGKPVPKIIDFGVAKATDHRLTERTLYTEEGRIIGTPEYMSPEQAEMTGLNVDTRTDIFSLGVILYELLVSALPFDPTELRQAGYFEIQRKIREDDPPKPSTRVSSLGAELTGAADRRQTDNASLVKELRGDLDWICMKAIEKDPTRRYQSASEFAADIERHLRHEPVQASPPSASYRLKKLLRRHRGQVAGAASVLLALVIGLIVSIYLYRDAEAAREVAEEARGVAEEAKEKASDNEKKARQAEKAARRSEREKAAQLRKARSISLALHATRLSSTQPDLALLLAIESARLHGGLVANNALLKALNASQERRTLIGHGSRLTHAEFGQDGSIVLTHSADETARIWDSTTGAVKHVFGGPASPISLARLSPDGSKLLAATPAGRSPGLAWLFDVDSGKHLLTLEREAEDKDIDAIRFSPDGSKALTRSADPFATLWSLASGKRLFDLAGHSEELNDACFSPNGRTVATASEDKTVRLWNVATGKESGVLEDHGGGVLHVAFSPDGKRLATTARDNRVRIWDLAEQRVAFVLEVEDPGLSGAVFDSEGSKILTIASTARTWDVKTGKALLAYEEKERVQHAAFSPDGQRILTIALGQWAARVWNARVTGHFTELKGHREPLLHGAFGPDSRSLVTASMDKTARVWDLR
ncbi:MAG: protein kinase, partial [Planctomycetota bacterium]